MSFFQRGEQEEIIKKYFSDPAKTVYLKKGETLLEQYEVNEKLYYVEKGKVAGYLPDKGLHEPVFDASEGFFVGVYSYFSEDRMSYSKVIAEEDSVVRYFDHNPFQMEKNEAREILSFLFNTVVKELRYRQHYAGFVAQQREESMQKLIQSEKMATLGQMSAGLAHELNNTIGGFSSNLGAVVEEISAYLKLNESKTINQFFHKGLEEGQMLSSSDARKLRMELEKLKFVNKKTAKTLARAGLDAKTLQSIVGKDEHLSKKIAAFWEMGYFLHDMQVATRQATHVIQSVKTVGVARQQWVEDADINQTVNEALAIIRSLSKNVDLKIDLDESLPRTEACPGELVQVWINIVKNAIESLVNSNTKDPEVRIETSFNSSYIKVKITDNGPGIPKSSQEMIFQPNFTTKVGGLSFGLGLGLTIVKRIVSEHNGDIGLKSKPGKTSFQISIPII